MLQSFFTGLSGMFNFSKTLDNVSNNIANMNTPGFRGKDTFFRSLNANDQGIGTTIENTSIRLNGGEIRQTGKGTDLAIAGSGLFVLRDDSGQLFYSRAGQFDFNSDGVFVDAVTGMEVMSISESGNLERIDISGQETLPAVATTNVSFAGNLSPTDEEFEVSPITIYDSTGLSHELNLLFENSETTTDIWSVSVQDEDGNLLGSGEIRFDNTGAPLTDFNTFSIDFTFNGITQAVNFDFGQPGSFAGARQFSGTSNLGASNIDGNGVLGIQNVSFDDKGIMQIRYSDGQINEGQQIALASFSDESKLSSDAGGLYRANPNSNAEYGRAKEGSFGAIQGGSIELSNVDLTQEFADIMIIQRGYQASSRVMSVSNELIEELYNNTRG